MLKKRTTHEGEWEEDNTKGAVQFCMPIDKKEKKN